MILVVNLNASLDKIYMVDDIKRGDVVRAKSVQNTAGGKGTHVANVINIMKETCMVTGFLGGKTGEFISDKLGEKGIANASVRINGETRACINIVTPDGKQTEVLEPGPVISDEEQSEFLDEYEKLLDDVDIVIASGSLPQNVAKDFYKKLIESANAKKKKFLLDTSGVALVEGIKAKPFFIKPNREEVEFLTGHKVQSAEDAAAELQKFMADGIALPVISLGKQGSVIGYNGKIYHAIPPAVENINAVGSGDAYVAGLAVALQRKLGIVETIRFASACGTANVTEKESGFVRREQVETLIEKVIVKKMHC